MPGSQALTAVLAYRAISFWLAIAIGWPVYWRLRREPPARLSPARRNPTWGSGPSGAWSNPAQAGEYRALLIALHPRRRFSPLLPRAGSPLVAANSPAALADFRLFLTSVEHATPEPRRSFLHAP